MSDTRSVAHVYTVAYSARDRGQSFDIRNPEGERHVLWMGRAHSEHDAIQRFLARIRPRQDLLRGADYIWIVRAVNVQLGLDFSTKAAEHLITDKMKQQLVREKFSMDREVFLCWFDDIWSNK